METTKENNQHSLDVNGKKPVSKEFITFKYKLIDVRNSAKVPTRAVSVKTKH